MQNGYLLDTNIVCRWHTGHAQIVARINALPNNTPLWISAISLGEIAFGNERYLTNRDLAQRDQFERWLDRNFRKEQTLPVSRHTRYEYGPIRAYLFDNYPPQGKSVNDPAKCYDKTTCSEIGFDENDLWIASQAIEHALILVTADKMEKIKEASQHARCSAPLEWEDWSV